MGFGEKGSGEVFGCGYDDFFRNFGWHLAVVWEPSDGLGNACAIGGGQPYSMTPVVVHGWPDVVAVGGMRGP